MFNCKHLFQWSKIVNLNKERDEPFNLINHQREGKSNHRSVEEILEKNNAIVIGLTWNQK